MILLIPILLPIIVGLLLLVIPSKVKFLKELLALIATGITLYIAYNLFGSSIGYSLPWCGFGIEFSLRLYQFSAFILAAIASFSFLIALYSTVFMSGKEHANQYYSYLLITVGMVAGAVLANNLLVMLFFWEGLLATQFGLIAIGRPGAFQTAIKAFIILGITDLCLMFGIILTGQLAGTLTISKIALELNGLGAVAFIFLMIGAIAKGGAMPFHSWIPDAALDAPLPFMALLPAAVEKLLGIYFLTRISLDLFKLTPESWLSPLLMTIGGLTIILAVMMALIQKDFKRLLSYHAISQVGYMILGIGTAVPAGIIGGLFHLINNALYKSCLFLAGGAVEKQTGTTDLKKLGGLGRKMPITFICFFIAAVSISGVPPFNGFFSKELVYEGALERGWVFYLLAVVGSFFTAASFLKLGHAAFLGKEGESSPKGREANWAILTPMLIIAAVCIFFGLYNVWPIEKLIQPVLGAHRLEGHTFAGWPGNPLLVWGTLIVLALALLNHWFGVKRSGSGLGASEHIHHAPVLGGIYDKAERRWFDPYDFGLKLADIFGRCLFALDQFVDWLHEVAVVKTAEAFSLAIRSAHNGNYSIYMVWSIIGTFVVLFYMVRF